MSKTTLNKTFDGSVVAGTLNIKMSGPITINAKKGSVVLKNNTGADYTFVIPRAGTWASPWLHGANKLGLELSYKGKTHTAKSQIIIHPEGVR